MPVDEGGTGQGGRLRLQDVSCHYGDRPAVEGVSLDVAPGTVMAWIGASGCGKSTLLRAVNRMHELTAGARVAGTVHLDGVDVYGSDVDATTVRRRVGLVFQRPNPFPALSIADNVAAGLRLADEPDAATLAEQVEQALRRANLWAEVSGRLTEPAGTLSGGQQQRLCIARAIAVRPAVLLMDEPCSALDPASTMAIEALIAELRGTYTIVIVTHNLQQATRVSDVTAFFTVDGSEQPGRLVEVGATEDLFAHPRDRRTQDYVSGRVG